jgi:hypothetical protein
MAAAFDKCAILTPVFSFFFAYTGESEMMYRIFGTPSFMQSRGMHRGFFVSRGYYSQGPPPVAAAEQRKAQAILLPPGFPSRRRNKAFSAFSISKYGLS